LNRINHLLAKFNPIPNVVSIAIMKNYLDKLSVRMPTGNIPSGKMPTGTKLSGKIPPRKTRRKRKLSYPKAYPNTNARFLSDAL